MLPDASEALTDRQARALVAIAEQHGFEREPHRIWWSYDKTLHSDAESARQHLVQQRPDLIRAALDAPDPMPAWAAVERIANERTGINSAHVQPLIDAAVDRGLMTWDPGERVQHMSFEWDGACEAIGLLWEHDQGALSEILGDHATIAMIPATAVAPCPSICEHGWVPYKLAGELPPERPDLVDAWR